MRPRRLFWQLYASYVLLTLLSLLAVGWVASHSLEQFYLDAVRDDLRVSTELLRREIAPRFSAGDADELSQRCRGFSRITGSRVTLILPSGQVLVDTHEDPSLMDNHADRPEMAAALAGAAGSAERYSSTLGERMTYLALPIQQQGRVAGAVRTAVSTASLDRAVRGVERRILTGALGVAGGAALMSLWFSRRVSRPLQAIRRGAERFAAGDLDYVVPLPATDELAGVAESLNRMALELEERIRSATRQSSEQEAVLASMVEGVLAVDTEKRLISLNQAAAELLGADRSQAPGRALQEVIRNAALQRFVAGALACDKPVEAELVLGDGHDRVLQAHGAVLRDAQGEANGAVIVLNDITRLRRLESLRRDFVANVSHELKTPITSIKGFVETLLDGALANADDAERFLRIIAKQADRLNSIIEDLLSLSKIEQGEQAGAIDLKDSGLKGVLEEAVHEVDSRAAERDVAISLACDDAVRAGINPPLLQQALLNLLDNAVKYSEPGQRVFVSAARRDSEVVIAVRDEGCGIEQEHLPRLFERFYRVDRARSRKLGGTGLGLAIVKHIVQAHRGQIQVESAPGQGSTFTIRLPAG